MNAILNFKQINANYYSIYHGKTCVGDLYYNRDSCKWKLTIDTFEIFLQGQFRNDLMEEAGILFNKAEGK